MQTYGFQENVPTGLSYRRRVRRRGIAVGSSLEGQDTVEAIDAEFEEVRFCTEDMREGQRGGRDTQRGVFYLPGPQNASSLFVPRSVFRLGSRVARSRMLPLNTKDSSVIACSCALHSQMNIRDVDHVRDPTLAICGNHPYADRHFPIQTSLPQQ